MGRHAASLWTSKRAFQTAKYFDSQLKHNFNPYDRECEANFEIPLVGAADIPEIGLEEGYFMLLK